MNYESSTPSHTEVERRVLSVLKELVGELRGDDREPRIRLQDSLEQDLGISSLERVELLRALRCMGYTPDHGSEVCTSAWQLLWSASQGSFLVGPGGLIA